MSLLTWFNRHSPQRPRWCGASSIPFGCRVKRPNHGVFTHNLVLGGVDPSGPNLRGIAKESGVVAEAPVPNASKGELGVNASNVGFGRSGYADLYFGAAATSNRRALLGVVRDSFKPEYCPRYAAEEVALRRRADHETNFPAAVPILRRPRNINVADREPSYGTVSRRRAEADEISLATTWRAREVNELSAAKKVSPSGATWGKTSFRVFAPGEIQVPAAFESGAGQRSSASGP